MRKIIFISIIFALFISCSPQKRVARLADKYGVIQSDTIKIDTAYKIPALHFDTTLNRIIDQDTAARIFVDTFNFILEDGTTIQVIDTTQEIRGENPTKLKRKTRFIVDRESREIPISIKAPFQKIVVEQPTIWHKLIDNIKWLTLSILAIFLILLILKNITK